MDLDVSIAVHSLACMAQDLFSYIYYCSSNIRADSRFAPSHWETALLCNTASHWLGANLESAQSMEKYGVFWGVFMSSLTREMYMSFILLHKLFAQSSTTDPPTHPPFHPHTHPTTTPANQFDLFSRHLQGVLCRPHLHDSEITRGCSRWNNHSGRSRETVPRGWSGALWSQIHWR